MDNKKYLIVDIETIPRQGAEPPVFDESAVKTGNLKDPAKIAAKVEEERAAWTEGLTKRMSVESDLCEIVSIGMLAVDHRGDVEGYSSAYYDRGDLRIIEAFDAEWRHSRRVLIGWNSKKFDIPILWKRSLAHMSPICSAVALADLTSPYRHELHIDLMGLWAASGFAKLKDAAAFLGLKAKDGMDGSQIYQAWQDGRHEEIQAYNRQDCEVTLKIAHRMGVFA